MRAKETVHAILSDATFRTQLIDAARLVPGASAVFQRMAEQIQQADYERATRIFTFEQSCK